jgi:hypothetical protein
MICSKCNQPLPHLAIRGTAYRAVKKTRIPKRYIDVNNDEVLYVLPIPLLVVQKKGINILDAQSRKESEIWISGTN